MAIRFLNFLTHQLYNMKYLILNNQIAQARPQIPGKFTRPNGERFFGGYQYRKDLHHEDGWRDEVLPEYDEETHYLGSPFYDAITDTVSCEVMQIDYKSMDIEVICAEKHEQFEKILEREMTPALMFGVIDKLAMGEPIPAETMGVIAALRTREAQVKSDIDAITDTKILKLFGFDRVEIEQSKQLLKEGRKL
jgi:hypothetical protein